MNLTCYVVDDEYHAIEILKDYIGKTPGLELKGSATNPLEALDRVVSAEPPQITFLDVDMPELSGMEFAGMTSYLTKVIFTTSYPEYAIEAFEKDATDYLLKPFSYERFLKAVNKVKKAYLEKGIGNVDDSYFYIKTDLKGKLLKINVAEIMYVEAALNYVFIFGDKGKQIAYLTMDEIEERLPKAQFLRVQRSFIINLEKIRTVEHGQVTLDDHSVIPLGTSYKGPLLTSMKERLLQSKRNTGG